MLLICGVLGDLASSESPSKILGAIGVNPMAPCGSSVCAGA